MREEINSDEIADISLNPQTDRGLENSVQTISQASDKDQEDLHKTIDLPEAIIMVSIALLLDTLDLLTYFSFIFIIGFIIYWFNWVFGIVGWWGLQFWLKMKDARGIWAFVGGSLVDLVPGIELFYWQTLGILITIYIANRPHLRKAVSFMGAISSK